jgi:hypothetical protein
VKTQGLSPVHFLLVVFAFQRLIAFNLSLSLEAQVSFLAASPLDPRTALHHEDYYDIVISY